MTGKQGPQSLKDIRTDRILTGKERRGDQSAPGVLSVATGWVPNLQSYTSAQPWVFIHSLLQLDQSVLHVPKACVCVCVCTCVLGEDICVCLLRDWGHLQCMQVESVLCVCTSFSIVWACKYHVMLNWLELDFILLATEDLLGWVVLNKHSHRWKVPSGSEFWPLREVTAE